MSLESKRFTNVHPMITPRFTPSCTDELMYFLGDLVKKYDLPVYQYPGGKVVMHRVVDVREECYVCLGDNTYRYEYIRPEWMIAVVTAFKRGEKIIR